MARPPRVNRRISLTPRTAKRITRAVLEVERGDRDIAATVSRPGGDDAMVRGTFSGAWSKDATKTVTDAILTGVTYTAKNYFASVGGSGTKKCCIAFVAGEWILIAAEC